MYISYKASIQNRKLLCILQYPWHFSLILEWFDYAYNF